MKRFIAVILSVSLLAIMSAGCGPSESSTKDPIVEAYRQAAEGFITKGDYQSAILTLEEGIAKTNDATLRATLESIQNKVPIESTTSSSVDNPSDDLPTSTPPTETVVMPPNTSMNAYIGSWAEEWTHWSCGGMVLDISIADNNLLLDCKYYSPAPDSNIASFNTSVDIYSIVDNCITVSFDDDGWNHSGKVTIEFLEDSILCLFYGLKFFGEGFTTWGFDSGEFTLYSNNQIHEELKYTQEDYANLYNNDYADPTPDPNPTYDTSKASGILASMGMSEMDFKSSCQPIRMDISSDKSPITRNLREYPSMYIGQCFTIVSTLGSPLPIEISEKGITPDGYTLYIYYPDQDWRDYIALFDMRDDVYSPTISVGDKIYPYMIFTGVQTVDGIDLLCFQLISVEKYS